MIAEILNIRFSHPISLDNMIRNSILTFISFVIVVSIQAQKLAVYFPYYRSVQQVNAVQMDKVTDVIYAFAQPTSDGLSDILEPTIFEALRARCSANNVPFHLAMGGFGLSDNFRFVAGDPALRTKFANHCASLCTTYGLAGIDIDWEFPSPSEVDNVNLLLEAIDLALEGISTPSQHFELSVTVGGEIGHADYFKKGFADYVDFVSIMAYDAPTAQWGSHSSMAFMLSAINVWENMDVPLNKMLVGVPFYGRCNGEASYADISASNPQAAYNSDDFGGYCYNGKPTLVAKTDSAMTKGCAGMMVWEITHDRSDQYSLLNVLDSSLAIYDCDIPEIAMNSTFSLCLRPNLTIESNVPVASGRSFSWFKNGAIVFQSTTSNAFQTSEAGNYSLLIESSECTREFEFSVTNTISLAQVPNDIVLCNPGIDTIFTGLVNNGSYGVLWNYNGNTLASTATFLPIVQAGVYTVSVNSTHCPVTSKTIQVVSNGIEINEFSSCMNTEAKLFASNTPSALKWYYNYDDASPFFAGDTLNLTISKSDTLYYEEPSVLNSQSFSSSENGVNQNASFYGTKFTVSSGAELKSFVLSPIVSGTVGVELLNANDLSSVYTTSVPVITGNNTIDVNWNLTAGTYILRCTESPAGQLKLFSDYTPTDSTKGSVTMHSGVYNSFSSPAFNDKSEFYGFFNAFIFESGTTTECGRKAIVINAENCMNCEIGTLSINNVLLTYGQPPFKVNVNYDGDNELIFISQNKSLVTFTNNFVKNLSTGDTEYTVHEVCNGDTLQKITANILVQKAELFIEAITDTIEVNDAPPEIMLRVTGYKFNDNETTVKLPTYSQSTDGTQLGLFPYTQLSNLISGNYTGVYNVGGLLVRSTVGIDDYKKEDANFVHQSNGKRWLTIRKAIGVKAYQLNGKLLWEKNFESGTYELKSNEQLIFSSEGEFLGR